MTAGPSDRPPVAARPRRGVALQEAGLLLVVLLLSALIAASADTLVIRGQPTNAFLRWDNLLANVATPMSWMAIMALGATLVIVSGGIDISVGSVFGLSALAAAAALQELPAEAPMALSLPVAAGAALGTGLLCGLLNGALVVGLRLHPFIVTLGTLSIFRGLGLVLVRSKTLPSLGHVLPASFTERCIGARVTLGDAGAGGTFIQPVPMLVMLACVAAIWIFLAHTVPGREIYAVGGNQEAARFAGLPVGRVKLRVYALAGLCAGLAGLLSCGFYQSANTATGEGYELTVIAAAVVGGASLSGGRGTALGALLGALIIKLIENGIDILKALPLGFATLPLGKEYGKIVIGVAILLAVAVDRLAERWRGRAAGPR